MPSANDIRQQLYEYYVPDDYDLNHAIDLLN